MFTVHHGGDTDKTNDKNVGEFISRHFQHKHRLPKCYILISTADVGFGKKLQFKSI